VAVGCAVKVWMGGGRMTNADAQMCVKNDGNDETGGGAGGWKVDRVAGLGG
jgi:hypothetical protein